MSKMRVSLILGFAALGLLFPVRPAGAQVTECRGLRSADGGRLGQADRQRLARLVSGLDRQRDLRRSGWTDAAAQEQQ